MHHNYLLNDSANAVKTKLRIDGKLSCTRGSSIIVAANYTHKTLEQVSITTLSSEMLKKITRTITGLICSMFAATTMCDFTSISAFSLPNALPRHHSFCLECN